MKKYKSFALLSVTILSMVLNTSAALANDNVTGPELIEQSTDEWLAYMDKETEVASKYIIHHNNRMYFDFDKAQNDGVSGEALDIGLEIERVSDEHMGGKFTPGTYFRSISIPIYGNYCGPGHNGNNFTLPAIDQLDWGCMEHDQCYKPWSPGENCACNRQLINFIQTNRRWMPSSAIPTANAIKFYFETVGLIGC